MFDREITLKDSIEDVSDAFSHVLVILRRAYPRYSISDRPLLTSECSAPALIGSVENEDAADWWRKYPSAPSYRFFVLSPTTAAPTRMIVTGFV